MEGGPNFSGLLRISALYSIAQCSMISENSNSLKNELNMQKQEKKATLQMISTHCVEKDVSISDE